MITNKELIKDPSMLFEDLEKSDLKFYPCGSRYFGWHKEDSDYDYFICKDTAYAEKLEALGFMLSERTIEYGDLDVNTEEIWYSYSDNHKRHVMLVLDAQARQLIQNDIRISGQASPKGSTGWWNAKYKEIWE